MKDVYVITGATGGIGLDISRKITKKDIVLLVDLDSKKLKELHQELTKKKIDAHTFICDISDKNKVKELVKKVEELGHFKALINAAGVSESMEKPKRILEINLMGTKLLMDSFYEIADNSVIINISSMTGHLVPDNILYNKLLLNPLKPGFLTKMKLFTQNKSQNAYAFSKKGVIMLTEREVAKWSEKKSRIVSVSPGAIETPLSLLEAEENPAVDSMISKTPISRFGKVSEVTSLIKYLCSRDAEFVNGCDILIDGGIVSHMKYNDIFGLKENKINKIIPTILYITLFLLLPLVMKELLSNAMYKNYLISSILIYNPIIIVLVTSLFMKKRTSIFLNILPVIIFLISCINIYNASALVYAFVYLVFAAFTSIIIEKYNKEGNK